MKRSGQEKCKLGWKQNGRTLKGKITKLKRNIEKYINGIFNIIEKYRQKFVRINFILGNLVSIYC